MGQACTQQTAAGPAAGCSNTAAQAAPRCQCFDCVACCSSYCSRLEAANDNVAEAAATGLAEGLEGSSSRTAAEAAPGERGAQQASYLLDSV
jgi:hypothetical protein